MGKISSHCHKFLNPRKRFHYRKYLLGDFAAERESKQKPPCNKSGLCLSSNEASVLKALDNSALTDWVGGEKGKIVFHSH